MLRPIASLNDYRIGYNEVGQDGFIDCLSPAASDFPINMQSIIMNINYFISEGLKL
jgi:hypothetical protein